MSLSTSCGGIELEPIRARIVINDTFTVETPYVKTISINKSRASNVGTFSASIEVPVNASFGTPTGSGGKIQIFAGTKDNYITKGPIFTGKIKSIHPSPTVGKPNYFTLSISGTDVLDRLQNKKFSRRIPSDGPGLFVTITGGASSRPSSMTWAIDGRAARGGSSGSFTNNKPDLTDRKEHNSLIHHRDYSKSSKDWVDRGGVELVPEPVGGQGGGLNVHDHSSQTTGGPAFGVYSPS